MNFESLLKLLKLLLKKL